MMIDGRYRPGRAEPRVVQLQITRYHRHLPRADEPLEFLVSLHVEGTAWSWQRNTVLGVDAEQELLARIDGLRRWSASLGLTRKRAIADVAAIGRQLRDVFLGRRGAELLDSLGATAVLVFVDETIIHLPWELLVDRRGVPLITAPFARVVGTRVVPQRSRDFTDEDPRIRILAIENPTDDLAAAGKTMELISSLAGERAGMRIEVITLERAEATRARVIAALEGGDVDIVHFAGHGRFDTGRPTDGSLILADGPLGDDDVLRIGWAKPPFLIVNSSCESGRAAPGKRIVGRGKRSNGLAAAFLSRGVEAYLGHYFLVGDDPATTFTDEFYAELFARPNFGGAVLRARERSFAAFHDSADLIGFSAVLFGDAGGVERRDAAQAA